MDEKVCLLHAASMRAVDQDQHAKFGHLDQFAVDDADGAANGCLGLELGVGHVKEGQPGIVF
jgi:hypothetical protein